MDMQKSNTSELWSLSLIQRFRQIYDMSLTKAIDEESINCLFGLRLIVKSSKQYINTVCNIPHFSSLSNVLRGKYMDQRSWQMRDSTHEQYLVRIGKDALEAKLNVRVALAASLGDMCNLLILPVPDEPLARPETPPRHAALRPQDEGRIIRLVGYSHRHTTDHLTATVGHLPQPTVVPIEDLILPGAAVIARVEPQMRCNVAEGKKCLGAGIATKSRENYQPVLTSESLVLNPYISCVIVLPQGHLKRQQYLWYQFRQSLPAMGPEGTLVDYWSGLLLVNCMGTIYASFVVPSLSQRSSCLWRKVPQQPLENRYSFFMFLSKYPNYYKRPFIFYIKDLLFFIKNLYLLYIMVISFINIHQRDHRIVQSRICLRLPVAQCQIHELLRNFEYSKQYNFQAECLISKHRHKILVPH